MDIQADIRAVRSTVWCDFMQYAAVDENTLVFAEYVTGLTDKEFSAALEHIGELELFMPMPVDIAQDILVQTGFVDCQREFEASMMGLLTMVLVRRSHSSVKQVSDTLFSENGNAFRKAVLVQWPREGIWTVAFVTGAPGGDVATYLREDEFLSVYVPTTPNPTGGYFVMLRKSECVELNMSVDEALKYVVSMGVVVPTMRPPAIKKNP